VVGSLLVGLVDAYGKALVPDLAYFTQFGPMVLMLAIRPQGIFGRKE
jgi:branched-chain amino acid transport system permease protein